MQRLLLGYPGSERPYATKELENDIPSFYNYIATISEAEGDVMNVGSPIGNIMQNTTILEN